MLWDYLKTLIMACARAVNRAGTCRKSALPYPPDNWPSDGRSSAYSHRADLREGAAG